MKITVCIGSACHIKGSRQIIEQFQDLIVKECVGEEINLGGSFCMGNCRKGVCVAVDGEVHSVSPESAEDFFYETVMPEVRL